MFKALLAVLSLGLMGPAAPQSPTTSTSSAPRFGKAVRSPEVSPDGRVTFRLAAPNAKKVSVLREDGPALKMSQDERGNWIATTEPQSPDYYVYSFAVDGVQFADPSNPLMKPVLTGGAESLVHVPGGTAPWDDKDVPHGTLSRHRFHSAEFGEDRDYVAYTPPGFDPRKRYPVLYLLHGVMEGEGAWASAGRVGEILDDLNYENKAKPMIVVMPLGYGFSNPADRVGDLFAVGPAVQRKFMDRFAKSFFEELVPNVEKAFPVGRSSADRAIAGVSMGGAEALYMGLTWSKSFGWIGSFSGAFIMYGSDLAPWFPTLDAPSRLRPRLLWLSCGQDDFLLGANRIVKDWLTQKGLTLSVRETPGSHSWTVWRRNLVEFAPLLFRK